MLIAVLGFYCDGEQENVRELLRYYQQTAQGLNQTERDQALQSLNAIVRLVDLQRSVFTPLYLPAPE